MPSHVVITRCAGPGAVVALAALLLVGCTTNVAGTASPVGGPAPQAAAASPGAGAGSEEALRAGAKSYVDAVNAGDQAAATGMTCSGATGGTLFEVAATDPEESWTVAGARIAQPGNGVVDIGLVGLQTGVTVPYPFTFDGQRWCVDY